MLKLANGDINEGHFAANGRHGLGECTYADGSQFIGEWRDDKPDTDAGKWVGVSEIEDLAETYKGQATAVRSPVYGFNSLLICIIK